MKIIKLVKYRLHRYLCSSRTVIPLIASVCFFGFLYSVKPVDVCSGYIMSGLFQFVLMTFVALILNGNEDGVEEQLIYLHCNDRTVYYLAREINLVVISIFYSILLIIGPVIVNCINDFDFFSRALTVKDVLMGMIIILGSGLAGVAIGDFFHPRIMKDRKMAVVLTIAVMVISIAKDAIIKEYVFLSFLGLIFPSVTKPKRDLKNAEYFETKPIVMFLIIMILYYIFVAIIKNLIMNRKKFS